MIWDLTVARKDMRSHHAGGAKDVFGRATLFKQIPGQRLAHELFVPLRAREDYPLVISYAGDPGGIELRGSQQIGDVGRLEGHDEHVAHHPLIDYRNLKIKHGSTGYRAPEQVRHLSLFGIEYPLGRFGVGRRRQWSVVLFQRVHELLVCGIDEDDSGLGAPQSEHGLSVKRL